MYSKMNDPHEEFDLVVLADYFGHSNVRSGGFVDKKADLIQFGLIEGRGKFRITTTAEKLVNPYTSEEEKQEALIAIIQRVPLWAMLFEKYTSKGESLPPDDELKREVYKFCAGLMSLEEAEKSIDEIRRHYNEDTKMIRMGTSQSTEKETNVHIEKEQGMKTVEAERNPDVWEVTTKKGSRASILIDVPNPIEECDQLIAAINLYKTWNEPKENTQNKHGDVAMPATH